MRNRKYHLYLTNDEYIHIIKSLIALKNRLTEQGKYTDGVDDLLIKFNRAKIKKLKVIYK